MTRILFFCLGNICRSPMAEFILKDLAAKRGLANRFEIASAGTSDEEEGNPVDPRARRKLDEKGIPHAPRRARQLTREDLKRYDLLVGMEARNVASARRMLGASPKIVRLLDFSDNPRDISDPWYTGDFERAFQDILEGCTALMDKLAK